MNDQDINLLQRRRSSYFNSRKNSIKGFKRDNLTIIRCPNGGYKNKKSHGERTTKLEDLLD